MGILFLVITALCIWGAFAATGGAQVACIVAAVVFGIATLVRFFKWMECADDEEEDESGSYSSSGSS